MDIIMQGVFIDKSIFSTKFACDYEACKGACCWTDVPGSLGGKLLCEEAKELRNKKVALNKFVSGELRSHHINLKQILYKRTRFTPIHEGVCVYSHAGNRNCCLKTANEKGVVSFGIPLHCELYPIELISKIGGTHLKLANTWSKECAPAFVKGKSLDIPVFRWCKTPIVRRFGEEFYNELERNYQLL